MRRTLGALSVVGVLLSATPVAAEERADWGVTVSAGAPAGSYCLLLRSGDEFRLVAVDPFAPVTGAGGGSMTFSDIRPGDRVDYAVTTWSGMDIAEQLHVTPMRQAHRRQ